MRYTSLRQPYDSYASLTERPGYLRLYGQESLNSCCNVRHDWPGRQQARHVQVETSIDFVPTCREQMAGLAYMYDTGNFYLLVKTRDEEYGCPSLDLKIPAKLRLIRSSHFAVDDVITPIAIPKTAPCSCAPSPPRMACTRNSTIPWTDRISLNWPKSPPTSSPTNKVRASPAPTSACTATT